jgi:hypothetical protein
VWTDSWVIIAGAGCNLICVGAGEELARKVLAWVAFEEWRDKYARLDGPGGRTKSSAGRMVSRKARRSRQPKPVQDSGSRPESARGICGSSPQNHQVTWLSHKTKTKGSAGRDEIRARREAPMSADTWRDHKACVGKTHTMAKAWPSDEEE